MTTDFLAPLAQFVSNPRTNLHDPGDFDVAIIKLATVTTEANWHYLYLLCLAHLSRQTSAAAKSFLGCVTKQDLIEALITNHRINDALHLRFADGGAESIGSLPLQLPARRWNFAGTDRLMSTEDIRRVLIEIQSRTRGRVSVRASTIKLGARFRALNDRLKDAVLMQLLRHASALNGMQWRRLTKRSQWRSVQVRLHYASGFLTATVRVGGLVARKTTVLPLLFGKNLSEAERRRIDSHFAARILSKKVFELLLALRSPKQDPIPALQTFYDLFLGEILSRADIVEAIRALGAYPPFVIATHGALAQVPFSALHDGHRFLIERFDVVHAPPLYANELFSTGEPDYEALDGGLPISKPPVVRVMADTVGLPGARREVRRYAELAAQGVNIEVHDGIDNESWSPEMFRRLIVDPGVAVLSCHVAASPLGASETAFLSPDQSRIQAGALFDEPLDADLLVLAGCSSLAKTDWFGGVEDSLASRFRKAGVRAVVTTLWPVSDDAARRYNECLVTALSQGLSRASAHGTSLRALRQLRVDVFTGETKSPPDIGDPACESSASTSSGGTYDHPYYWAPFVLSGAWR